MFGFGFGVSMAPGMVEVWSFEAALGSKSKRHKPQAQYLLELLACWK